MNQGIPFFPSIYPDEDFRSIIYRYHIRSKNVNMMTTRQELFNKKALVNTHFPCNFMFLNEQLNGLYEIQLEKILYEHTLFPLYKSFLSGKSIMNEMDRFNCGDGQNLIVNKSFNDDDNRILSENIQYCPLCLGRDYEIYGEVYVHRLHQLAFLDFCPDHLVYLITKCPKCNQNFTSKEKDDLLTSPNCKCGTRLSTKYQLLDIKNSNIKFKMKFYKDIKFLMEQSTFLNREMIFYKFFSHLLKNGYMYYSGNIKKDVLIDDFLREVPVEQIEMLKIPISYVKSKEIKTKLFRSETRSQNIYFYILLMRFLAGDTEKFLNYNEPFSMMIPFGNGPWSCVNKICLDYERNRIFKIIRKNISRDCIYGVFECEKCGQIYRREWKWGDPVKGSSPIVMKLGFLWEKKLINFYNQGLSLNEISSRLHASKWKVKENLIRLIGQEKYLNRERVHYQYVIASQEFKLGQEQVSASIDIKDQPLEYKSRLQEALDNGNLTRMDIRKYVGQRIYDWLMKHEREWMEKVLPQQASSNNWNIIDSNITQEIMDVAREVYNSNPARRIKKHTILNALSMRSKNRIIAHNDKLPKSMDMLNSLIETYEEYQIRHIPVMIKQIKTKNFNSALNEISKRGLYKNCSPGVLEGIIKQLERLF